MENQELVSIIMPAYNVSAFIEDTIFSVLEQTYANWELVIVDDCSTDNTAEIIRSFNDDRIKYILNEENSGAALSRNRALREAQGKYIAFLDSDDLWVKEKLEKQVKFMQENDYKFSATYYEEIDENSQPLNILVKAPKKIGKLKMFQFCWIGCLTVMYDREAVGLIQIPKVKTNNDYAMWLKVIKKVKCYMLCENLARYRRARVGSISNIGIRKKLKSLYTNFRVAQGINPICSFFLTVGNLFFGTMKKIFYVKKVK